MGMLRNMFARGRVRRARKTLSESPSPRTFAALAQEHARLGNLHDVLSVCEEGLAAFPGNTILLQLAESTRRMECEARMIDLRHELEEAPRPALWAETCDILLELGRLMRAEEAARQWSESFDDDEARLMLARILLERFVADRARDLGEAANVALDAACAALPEDQRAFRLRLTFLMKIGAWKDALDVAKHLLQLDPGAPELEGQFRSLEDRAEGAPTIERALFEVERTGQFEDTGTVVSKPLSTGQVRPVLRELVESPDVKAALYVRGSTVLIQGPRGATAERISRSVRAIHSSAQATTRRLGLGRIFEIQVEGDYGQLTIAPSDMDAGAVWTDGPLGSARKETLLGLAGLNADVGGQAS